MFHGSDGEQSIQGNRRSMKIAKGRITLLTCSLAFCCFLSNRSDGAETRKMTLGYSTLGPAGTGLWMAREIGAFEKHGIDADLIFISAGPIVVQALIGGDLQAGLAATNAVIAGVSGGAPLISVMSLVNRPYYRLWV